MSYFFGLAKTLRCVKKAAEDPVVEHEAHKKIDTPAQLGLQRWYLDVSGWDQLLPSQWTLLLSLLPDAESKRVQRYKRENDRRLALGSRLLQRAVVSKVFGVRFADVEIKRTSERSNRTVARNLRLHETHQCDVAWSGINRVSASRGITPGWLDVETVNHVGITPRLLMLRLKDVLHRPKTNAVIAVDETGRCIFMNKPYFAAKDQVLPGRISSSPLRNWNFNVSHHGKYVAIASEPMCLCGVDVVDTMGRRRSQSARAEEYFRYFTDHFTEEEWEYIRGAPNDDERLRRFFLNWGLKESFVKAVGQGLGFNLRRISFIHGDWLDCCSKDEASDREVAAVGVRQRDACACAPAEGGSFHGAATSEAVGTGEGVATDTGVSHVEHTLGVGTTKVKLDGLLRSDWSFQVIPLPDGYVACIARGPPWACSPSGLAAGIIADPKVAGEDLAEGLALPQIGFEAVQLCDLLPVESWQEFLALGSVPAVESTRKVWEGDGGDMPEQTVVC